MIYYDILWYIHKPILEFRFMTFMGLPIGLIFSPFFRWKLAGRLDVDGRRRRLGCPARPRRWLCIGLPPGPCGGSAAVGAIGGSVTGEICIGWRWCSICWYNMYTNMYTYVYIYIYTLDIYIYIYTVYTYIYTHGSRRDFICNTGHFKCRYLEGGVDGRGNAAVHQYALGHRLPDLGLGCSQ